jgi:hypothetical protein
MEFILSEAKEHCDRAVLERGYDCPKGGFALPRPSDPQSFNRFAFVRNNPLKYVDPSGHCFGLAAGADTLACLGAGASSIAAAPIILLGVTGGILLASTYCAAEGCGVQSTNCVG